MQISDFRFHIDLKVRNYEVDWQGIVHNAVYLEYFETARIDYLHHIGMPVTMHSIQNDGKVVLVRNELNYHNSARYGDSLQIYTRVSSIRNTSFIFEGLMLRKDGGLLLSDNVAYHVWISPSDNRPIRVPEHFRSLVRAFEGDSVEIAGSRNG